MRTQYLRDNPIIKQPMLSVILYILVQYVGSINRSCIRSITNIYNSVIHSLILKIQELTGTFFWAMKAHALSPRTAIAVLPPLAAAFMAYSIDFHKKTIRWRVHWTRNWQEKIFSVPIWYRCPCGLKIVMWWSKLPDILLSRRAFWKTNQNWIELSQSFSRNLVIYERN